MKKILGASLIDGIFSSSICKYNAPPNDQETRWYLYICETIYKTLESKIISRLFLSRLSRSNLLFTFPPPPKVKPSNLYFPYLRNIYILDLHEKKKNLWNSIDWTPFLINDIRCGNRNFSRNSSWNLDEKSKFLTS